LKHFTKEEIVRALKSNNPEIIQSIYDEGYPYIEAYINSNSGNNHDAREIIQKGLAYVCKKAKNNELIIKKDFGALFFSICKNMWLKDLNRKKKDLKNKPEIKNHLYNDPVTIKDPDEMEIFDLFEKHLNNISPQCQKVLRMFFKGISYKDMAILLNTGSGDYLKSLKYKCKEQLKKNILNDPYFKKNTFRSN